MAGSTPLAPMIGPDAVTPIGGAPIRSPKTAELVAGTLRRMVVDGQLKEGDFLPNEAELMSHFGVSRPTLREAVRVLESERLVEVRRGSRTGARVRVPGPEIVARPAGLLLELSGATIADVMVARAAVEPMAVRLLAESGNQRRSTSWKGWWPKIFRRAGSPDGWPRQRRVPSPHRGAVGQHDAGRSSPGMLHEITVRHIAFAIKERRRCRKPQYEKLMRSYRRLMRVDAGRRRRRGGGALAQAHRHRA